MCDDSLIAVLQLLHLTANSIKASRVHALRPGRFRSPQNAYKDSREDWIEY